MSGNMLVTRVDGIPELTINIERFRRKALKAMAGTIREEMEFVMNGAKRMVPVDTGALRSSGFIELPFIFGDRVEVTGGFGGPSAPYAVYVHENLDLFHINGQAKYLEIPFNESTPTLTPRVAAETARKLLAT